MNTKRSFIKDYRNSIDEIDAALVKLLDKRMSITEKIGNYKALENRPISDPVRETALLNRIQDLAKPDFASYDCCVFRTILDCSVAQQKRIKNKKNQSVLLKSPGFSKILA